MARGALEFSSHFSNNALVIVDALGESDLQTAIHLRDEIYDETSASRPGYCHYLKVESASQFLAAIEQVNEQTKDGLRPILHIEAHGDEHLGIQVAASGEMVPWSQLLPKLQEINKNSKNNLGVVMAACFGLYAIKPLQIEEPCPFYFLVGSDERVPAGYIDDAMRLFYLELNRSNSLDDAMMKVDVNFKQFHAEIFFYTTFAKYMKRACMGAGAQKRVERLLTEAVEGGAVTNRATLRALRKRAKTFVRSQEQVFNKYSSKFLHGRKSVTYEEFLRFVRGHV
jgi:hypothetical protein